MDIPWNNNFILSLSDIALRRVLINVCSSPIVLSLIEKFQTKLMVSDFENKRLESLGEQRSNTLPSDEGFQTKQIAYNFEKEWYRIVGDQISGKLSELLVPESIKKLIEPNIKRIGLQMVNWKVFHEKYLNEEFGIPFLSKLCWTYSGMIDYPKTAEAIIKCEMLDTVKLYKLGCINCLVDYIPVYWEKLPTEIQTKFVMGESTSCIELPRLWPCEFKIEIYIDPSEACRHSLPFDNPEAFQYSARRGNMTAAKYFFEKLTLSEKNNSMHKIISGIACSNLPKVCQYPDDFPSEKFSELFLYLLSQMNDDQHMLIFRYFYDNVLYSLLDLPWQDLYLENKEKIWACVSKNCYDKLFVFMRYFTMKSDIEFYFSKFLRELYNHSPADFRKHFAQRDDIVLTYFSLLLKIGDAELISVVLGELDYAERVELLCSEKYLYQFRSAISSKKLHLVKMCLENARLSQEDLLRLLDTFVRFNLHLPMPYFSRKFGQVIKEICASTGSKRHSEDENQTEAVKPCKKQK